MAAWTLDGKRKAGAPSIVETPPPVSIENCFRSGRLRDLARLDAGRADLHANRPALRALDAYGLKVWVEAAARAVVRVRDVVAELRPLAADFASFSHYVFFKPPSVKKARAAKSVAAQSRGRRTRETKTYS